MAKARVKIGEVLFTQSRISERLAELAREIQERYAGKDLTIVAVLKGSLFFAVDLLRLLDMPVRVDVLEVSSYFDDNEPIEDAKLLERAPRGWQRLWVGVADYAHDNLLPMRVAQEPVITLQDV